MASLYKKKLFMIQIVIMDLFPIGLFLNGAWILKFFSSTKLTINSSNYNSNRSSPQNGSNALHAPNF